ncbi:MAG: hypothetical protein OEL56_07130 [Nitrosopumilus sp.]|nr:hypothetical protein [Nitrosopumilus sp.]MDH3490206.1 hypothetical protein [Nitrosopumilus sp.]MDH3516945.1 hypothetical protein [Nitrosopumilus sp.]MDH3565320.1 hypothetical protein [Nitrosopumilus sp.]MDH5417020.1 hypothetical protein [Nitrosopumilus sp.]
MSEPPESVFGDEICPMCGKAKNHHDSDEIRKCSEKLVEMGIMRYCGLCGLTKPALGVHDRCGKCNEKYSFSNS